MKIVKKLLMSALFIGCVGCGPQDQQSYILERNCNIAMSYDVMISDNVIKIGKYDDKENYFFPVVSGEDFNNDGRIDVVRTSNKETPLDVIASINELSTIYKQLNHKKSRDLVYLELRLGKH